MWYHINATVGHRARLTSFPQTVSLTNYVATKIMELENLKSTTSHISINIRIYITRDVANKSVTMRFIQKFIKRDYDIIICCVKYILFLLGEIWWLNCQVLSIAYVYNYNLVMGRKNLWVKTAPICSRSRSHRTCTCDTPRLLGMLMVQNTAWCSGMDEESTSLRG
jgi:hypothetical protein